MLGTCSMMFLLSSLLRRDRRKEGQEIAWIAKSKEFGFEDWEDYRKNMKINALGCKNDNGTEKTNEALNKN